MGFAAAVGAAGCEAGPSVGAVELQTAILEVYEEHGFSSLGIYNCRRQGGATSPWSLHAEGRAIDIRVPVDRPLHGYALLGDLMYLAHGTLQRVIFDHRVYDLASEEGRAYTGPNPHEDHLHIELSWPAARGEIQIALPQDSDSEDYPMPNLIVAFRGAQWCVSPDLTSRVGLAQGVDVQALLKINQGRSYVPATLSESLMLRIPEVRS